jgi:glycosyltransferase involved in cell wall biosynthesis
MELISGTQPNGAVLQCIALIRELAARNHELTLVCRPGAWIKDRLADVPIEIIESDLHRWPGDELRRLAGIVADRRIQVLHSHMSRGHSFGVMLHWYSRTPIVATAHCRRVHPQWRCNDFVIANSQATLQFNRRWNFVSRCCSDVIPYLIDLQAFADDGGCDRAALRADWGLSDDQPLIGVVGDVSPRKGHWYLVRALPRILAAVPTARLVIVGRALPDYRAKVMAEAHRLRVADSILWTGYRDDIPRVMRTIDVCVSAALEEALGLTMPESLAAGRPVVATRVGGLPENIEPGRSGLLVPPAQPAAMADAVIRLLRDSDLRSAMGAAGREYMFQKYDTPRDVARTEQIFAGVISAARQQRRYEQPAMVGNLGAWSALEVR